MEMNTGSLMFQALYTHQKVKKKKTWQDGYLIYYQGNKKATLISIEKKSLESFFVKESAIYTDAELECDRYLIQVADNVSSNTSQVGKEIAFESNNGTASRCESNKQENSYVWKKEDLHFGQVGNSEFTTPDNLTCGKKSREKRNINYEGSVLFNEEKKRENSKRTIHDIISLFGDNNISHNCHTDDKKDEDSEEIFVSKPTSSSSRLFISGRNLHTSIKRGYVHEAMKPDYGMVPVKKKFISSAFITQDAPRETEDIPTNVKMV